MTSRINIARPAHANAYASSYTTPDYGNNGGMSGNMGGGSGFRSADASDADSAIAKLRAIASQVEDYIEIYSQPLKPHLPSIGRFLIVVTFLEDAWRIMTQWSDQLWYLHRHRKFPWGISHTFLLVNIIVMIIGSGAVITRRHTEYAAMALLGVVIIQGFGYGLIFDLTFFLRNLSVMGGLFMVFSDSMISRRKPFAGLPSISETDRKKYFLLAGRVLLIFLFLGFIIQGSWSIGRVFVSIVGLVACVMVAVGFKAKWSAAFLVIVLSVFNVIANNFWAVHSAHPQRDFLKYDFFQTLSIVGGLLLLVNMGPGGLSVDEKKKVY